MITVVHRHLAHVQEIEMIQHGPIHDTLSRRHIHPALRSLDMSIRSIAPSRRLVPNTNRLTPNVHLRSLVYPNSTIHITQLDIASLPSHNGPLTIAVRLVDTAPVLEVAITGAADAGLVTCHAAADAAAAAIFVRGTLAADEVAAEAELVRDDAQDGLEGGEAAAPETDVAFEVGPDTDCGHLVGSVWMRRLLGTVNR